MANKKTDPTKIKNWNDLYKLPLHKAKYGSWVYDAKHNFVFQFESQFNDKGDYAPGWKDFEQKVLACLNTDTKMDIPNFNVVHDEGQILIVKDNGAKTHIITIRGWGNLTGTGAHNLPGDVAAMVQDTFANWIVEKLNQK